MDSGEDVSAASERRSKNPGGADGPAPPHGSRRVKRMGDELAPQRCEEILYRGIILPPAQQVKDR